MIFEQLRFHSLKWSVSMPCERRLSLMRSYRLWQVIIDLPQQLNTFYEQQTQYTI